jgi:Icc protein
VHSVVPMTGGGEVTGFSADSRPTIEAMSAEQRLEMFSRKKSDFNLGVSTD